MPGVNKSRISPRLLRDLCDDLAVEVDHTLRARGMRLRDLEGPPYNMSPTRVKQISAWMRGAPTQLHLGHVGAIGLAEQLGIPVRILVGDEARETRS